MAKNNPILLNLYEELCLNDPDWIPDEYAKAVRHFADGFAGKNQLPVRDGKGALMYPIDKTLVRNRTANKLMLALMNGVEVPQTDYGVDQLLTKNTNYMIMMNGREERALCKAAQDSKLIENDIEREDVRDRIANVAISFLSPRLRFIYRRFEKAVAANNAYEDVAQELVLAMLKMLEDFDFERTTAGITRDYMNGRMFRAINNALSANRTTPMAQETWSKVNRFAATPEDHCLSKQEVMKKYRCSAGLVDLMFTFVSSNGSLEVSLDYVPDSNDSTPNMTNYSPFGECIQSNDQFTSEVNLDMTLHELLTPEQYEVLKLKMQGFSHQAIADMLHFSTKRRSQYLFVCARDRIEEEFNVDASEYTRGIARARCQKERDERLIAQGIDPNKGKRKPPKVTRTKAVKVPSSKTKKIDSSKDANA